MMTAPDFASLPPAGNYPKATEYLRLIQQTDRAFASFTQMLEEWTNPPWC